MQKQMTVCQLTMLTEAQILANPNFGSLLQKMVNDRVEKQLEEKLASQTNKARKVDGNGRLIKSPSDTTLYAPALKRKNHIDMEGPIPLRSNEIGDFEKDRTIQNISNFVENI